MLQQVRGRPALQLAIMTPSGPALLLLQKMFGHSTSAQTLDYIGITGEEIEEAYMQLNLGGRRSLRLMDSTIVEQPAG